MAGPVDLYLALVQGRFRGFLHMGRVGGLVLVILIVLSGECK